MRPRLLCVALAFLAAACRPETVLLEYRFAPGTTVTYELVASVHAEWDVAGEGEGSYRATFDVTQRVESSDEDGSVLAVQLHRTDFEQDNFAPPGDSSFKVRIDEHGAVLQVLEVDGVAASLLTDEQRSVIRGVLPKLPLEPVALYAQWPALQEFEGPQFERISFTGRLERLDVDEKGELANISYTGRGPLIGTADLPEGDAELDGTTSTTGEATLDLDEGVLRAATSTSRSDFDVTVIPEDAATSIEGSLHIEETIDLNRTGEVEES
jgi:hypothetical protein